MKSVTSMVRVGTGPVLLQGPVIMAARTCTWLLALLAVGTDASALGETWVPPTPTLIRPAALPPPLTSNPPR